MSENRDKETQQPEVRVMGIYTKQATFESSTLPILCNFSTKPDIKLEIGLQIKPMEEGYEVNLKLTIPATLLGNLVFFIQVQQAGYFIIKHFSEEQQQFFCSVTAPNHIYPYACQMANNLAIQGGFPSLNLAPLNFDNLHAQKKQEMATPVETQMSQQLLKSENGRFKENNKWANFNTIFKDVPNVTQKPL